MPKYIDITIDEDATVTIDAIGYTGPSCEKATAAVVAALGGKSTKTRKPDYYRQTRTADVARTK